MKLFFSSALFIFFATYSYADPFSGVVTTYSQKSDWKNQEHQVCVEFALDEDANKIHSILVDLSLEEMIEFSVEEGAPLTIISESPDTLIFQSLFQLQFGESGRLYEGKGSSIHLTAEEWGVDEYSLMVTEAFLNRVTFNGKDSIYVNFIIGDPVGRVFSKYPVENFIPNKIGTSTFVYYSRDGESYFEYEGPSKDSHWMPSAEETATLREVVEVSRYENYIRGHLSIKYIVKLSGGVTEIVYFPNIKVGNRWIQVQGGWLDLDAALLITPGSHGNTHRAIVKAWQ